MAVRCDHNGLIKCILMIYLQLLVVNSFITPNRRTHAPSVRFMVSFDPKNNPLAPHPIAHVAPVVPVIPIISAAVAVEKRQYDFKALIEKCSENCVYTPAVRAAAQYLHSADSLTQSGVTSVIKIYGLAAMVDDAVEALSIAESKGVCLNVRHYNAVINVCRKHKRYDDAVLVYERLLDAASSTFSSKDKQNKNNISNKPFLRPDIASRSSIIGVLGELGNWQRAMVIFKEVKVEDRDTILYTTMLGTLEKNSRTVESLEIFEEMMLTSNKNIQNSQSGSQSNCLSSGQTNKAPVSPQTTTAHIDVSESDVKSGQGSGQGSARSSISISPTLQMYTSIISVFGKAGDWERAFALFQNMQAPQGGLIPLVPDKVLVFTMVRILEKAGQLERAAQVKQSSFKASSSSYVEEPSAPNFNDLIREGKRSGDFRAGVAAADSWLALKSSLLSPSGVTACINVYGLSMQPNKALAVLNTMRERGVEVNVVQYNAIMAACVKGNKLDDALRLFRLMRDAHDEEITARDAEASTSSTPSSSSSPSSTSLSSSPPSSSSSPSSTTTTSSSSSSSPSSSYPPLVRDMYSYGTALHALGKKRSWREALTLLEHLDKGAGQGVQKTTIMCNTVLSALGKAQQYEFALTLYTSMSRKGPVPDRVTRLTMVTVFELMGRYSDAAVLRVELGMGPLILKGVPDGIDEMEGTDGGNAVNNAIGVGGVDGGGGATGSSIVGSVDGVVGVVGGAVVVLEGAIEIMDKSTDIVIDRKKIERKIEKKIGNRLKNKAKDSIDEKNEEKNEKNEKIPISESEPFFSGVRLSPAGTLRDKLMESGRRRVKKIISDSVIVDAKRENGESESKIGGMGTSAGTGKERVEGRGEGGGLGVEDGDEIDLGSDLGAGTGSGVKALKGLKGSVTGDKWEKGGGGAASIIRILGLARRSDEAEELLYQLEGEISEGDDPLPTSLYNAAIAACSTDRAWERAMSIYHRMLSHNGSTGGVGAGRDIGTYKALLPILEDASRGVGGVSAVSVPAVIEAISEVVVSGSPVSEAAINIAAVNVAVISLPAANVAVVNGEEGRAAVDVLEMQRARVALETVRSTGRIEGLIFTTL